MPTIRAENMPMIREVKTELRHREWAEQIQECQSSGMTVTAWCKEKGISQHTYYSRLNVLRKELLKRAELPLQQIVPLSVSQSVTCTTAAVQTQYVADSAAPIPDLFDKKECDKIERKRRVRNERTKT